MTIENDRVFVKADIYVIWECWNFLTRDVVAIRNEKIDASRLSYSDSCRVLYPVLPDGLNGSSLVHNPWWLNLESEIPDRCRDGVFRISSITAGRVMGLGKPRCNHSRLSMVSPSTPWTYLEFRHLSWHVAVYNNLIHCLVHYNHIEHGESIRLDSGRWTG